MAVKLRNYGEDDAPTRSGIINGISHESIEFIFGGDAGHKITPDFGIKCDLAKLFPVAVRNWAEEDILSSRFTRHICFQDISDPYSSLSFSLVRDENATARSVFRTTRAQFLLDALISIVFV